MVSVCLHAFFFGTRGHNLHETIPMRLRINNLKKAANVSNEQPILTGTRGRCTVL